MQVNFLIGGTEPAGTNQLWHLLKGHSDICLPLSTSPEPNFFSKALDFQKGAEHYHRRFFSHFNGEPVVGEKSGRYLWHPEAAGRIQAYNPGMKLIFMLRDPVDRSYSNYRFNCLNGIETLSFGKALAAEPRRVAGMSNDPFWRDVQPYAYFDKGLYAGQLARYQEFFPPQQIYIMASEALRRAPRAEVMKVLGFLGLSAERYRFVEDAPEYPSFHVRSLIVQKMIRSLNRPFLERLMIRSRGNERPTWLEAIALLNFSNKRTQPEPEVTHALRLRYREDLLRLRQLVDLDISGWLDADARGAPSTRS